MTTVTIQTTVLAAEEPSPLMPHLSELIIGLTAFAILFFFLRKYAWPAFERAYAQRAEAIDGNIQRAEQAQAEAQRTLEEYRELLAGARTEAAQIRSEAQSERSSIIAEAREEARVAAQAEAERVHAQLNAEVSQVRAALSREVGRLAVDLAEKIVGETLDEERTRGTVDRFIDELEAMAPEGESR